MKISNWAFQWKMIFNPDINKQAQEVTFSRKINKLIILHYILIKTKSNNHQLTSISE